MGHPLTHLVASCSSRSQHNHPCQTKDKLRRRPRLIRAFTLIHSVRKKCQLPRWIKLSIHGFKLILRQNLSFPPSSHTQAHVRTNAEARCRLNSRSPKPISKLELNRTFFSRRRYAPKKLEPLTLGASGAEHRLRLTTSSRRFHSRQYSAKAKSPQTKFGGFDSKASPYRIRQLRLSLRSLDWLPSQRDDRYKPTASPACALQISPETRGDLPPPEPRPRYQLS